MNYVSERRNSVANINARYEYALEFTGYDISKVLFVDESGFKVTMRRRMGRAKVGSRASKAVKQINSRNISICSAVSFQKMVKYKTFKGSFNTVLFNDYITDLVEILRNDMITGYIFVMDNCSIHKSAELRNIITAAGHSLVFLPPYSPFLNPIEEVFSQWKSIVTKGDCMSDENELFERIENAFLEISPENCRNYFGHMRQYLKRSLEKQEIWD